MEADEPPTEEEDKEKKDKDAPPPKEPPSAEKEKPKKKDKEKESKDKPKKKEKEKKHKKAESSDSSDDYVESIPPCRSGLQWSDVGVLNGCRTLEGQLTGYGHVVGGCGGEVWNAVIGWSPVGCRFISGQRGYQQT